MKYYVDFGTVTLGEGLQVRHKEEIKKLFCILFVNFFFFAFGWTWTLRENRNKLIYQLWVLAHF